MLGQSGQIGADDKITPHGQTWRKGNMHLGVFNDEIGKSMKVSWFYFSVYCDSRDGPAIPRINGSKKSDNGRFLSAREQRRRPSGVRAAKGVLLESIHPWAA